MSQSKHHRLSLLIEDGLWNQIDEVKRLSGKTRNAVIKELIMHSISTACEHYKELRILELKRLEKEKNTPFKEI